MTVCLYGDAGFGYVVSVESRRLSLTIVVSTSLKNSGARGLYGNYNDDPSDDLIARDETTLPPTSSEETIYNEFGLSCTCTHYLQTVFSCATSWIRYSFVRLTSCKTLTFKLARPCNRPHCSYGDCLEDKKVGYWTNSLLYCNHSCAHSRVLLTFLMAFLLSS